MTRYILTLLALLSISTTQAQFITLSGSAGVSAHSNYSPSFSNFFNTYNELNANILKEPFDTSFGPMMGKSWQVTFGANTGGFDYRANSGVTYYNTRNHNVFINNDERHLRLNMRDWTVDMGLGFGSERFYLNANIGMNLRMANLFSYYQFSDGTKSYGLDHKLNGVYESWRLTGLFGGTMGIGITENIWLQFKVDYVPGTQDDDTYKADFGDVSDFKQDNGDYFPQDMHRYVANNIDLFNNAFNDFKGMRFSISLEIGQLW